jgi:hypothetical protein
VRISVTSAVVRGGRVIQSAGPWRTSGAWWEIEADSREPASTPWDRDEWDVVVTSGTVLRVSRDRVSGEWFVEGVLD